MAAYGDVRNWQLQPIEEAIESLRQRSEELHDSRDRIAVDGRPAIWSSPTSMLADALRRHLADQMDDLVGTVDLVRRATAQVADGVSVLRRLTDEAEDLARMYHLTITDDGTVMDLRPHDAGVDAGEREWHRRDVQERVMLIVRRGQELDNLLAETIAAAIAGTVNAVLTDDPAIPGPPPRPPTDPGAGEHGSDPWWTIGDDLAKRELAGTAAGAADAIGLTNAARHMRHYLGNSGGDLAVDPDRIGRDAEGFQRSVDQTTSEQLREIADRAQATGAYGQATPFVTGWNGYYVSEGESRDWFYAMGGLQYSVAGVATVYPSPTPGGEPTVDVDYQVHVFDRYNWDEGKAVEIGPVTIRDEELAEMHRAGVAQEYDVVGTSDTRHYHGQVAADGDPSLPQPPDNRDGTRTDPAR